MEGTCYDFGLVPRLVVKINVFISCSVHNYITLFPLSSVNTYIHHKYEKVTVEYILLSHRYNLIEFGKVTEESIMLCASLK